MGLFDGLRLAEKAVSLRHADNRGIVSPWNSPNHLQTVVLSDIFGSNEKLPITRADAMRVPSVAKARALICGTAAKFPLRAMRTGTATREQPSWMYRTNSQVSPQQRILWTFDDLLFFGWSLWAVERGAQDQILDAVRVPHEWWRFDGNGIVEVKKDGDEFVPADAEQVILFSGPQEGLVEIGSRAIRQYQDLESTRASRLRNPVASVVLHATEEINLDDDEIQQLVDDYANGHRSSSLAVSYLPHNISLEEHGTASPELFLQMENAINVQIAQLTNVPATLLDASIEGGSSLTYQNTHQTRSWFVDTTLGYWLNPVEARLSMDDALPRGQYAQFDTTQISTFPPERPALED